MIVVSNSSPLIALSRIQRLDLLRAVFESMLIPPAVVREIAPSIPVLPTWLRVQAPKVPPPGSVVRRRLGDGEWEALALAIELKADWIVLDDLPARRAADATGLNVIGTLGTLITAKRAGLLKSIRPELDALVRTSFFLSPQLYDDSGGGSRFVAVPSHAAGLLALRGGSSCLPFRS